MNLPDTVASIPDRLALVPSLTDVSLVLRHAEREEIPPGSFGEDVRLMARGVASAEGLGSLLSGREPVEMKASPVPRCMHTAEAIARGAGWDILVGADRLLGDPGPFVTDPGISGPLFLEIGILELVRRQLMSGPPPPGMRPASEGVRLLLGLVAGNLEEGGRLNVYVTHDAILAVLVARLFRLGVDDFAWPGFLDGLLLWRTGEGITCSWRGLH